MTSEELSTIYKTYGGMVERQAVRVLRDAHLAQDVAHEVFIKFIEYSAKTQVNDVGALLYQMATQGAIKRLRKHSVRATLENLWVTQKASPANDVEARLAFEKLLGACDETRAEIAVHYFLDGMSQQEIADLMKLTRRAVGRHLERFSAHGRKVVGAAESVAQPSNVSVRYTR